MEIFPKTIDKMIDLWYTIIVPRENTINKREVFIMYEIQILLGNDVRHTIPFFSKWAAGYFVESKKLYECADVEKVLIIDTETGEVVGEWL